MLVKLLGVECIHSLQDTMSVCDIAGFVYVDRKATGILQTSPYCHGMVVKLTLDNKTIASTWTDLVGLYHFRHVLLPGVFLSSLVHFHTFICIFDVTLAHTWLLFIPCLLYFFLHWKLAVSHVAFLDNNPH